MRCSILLLAVLLGACSADFSSDRAAPERAILYTNSVNVIMSEGSLCALNRPGNAMEWSGHLGGCLFQYPVTVQMAGKSGKPRTVLQKTPVAPAGKTVVRVTDTTGTTHLFTSP